MMPNDEVYVTLPGDVRIKAFYLKQSQIPGCVMVFRNRDNDVVHFHVPSRCVKRVEASDSLPKQLRRLAVIINNVRKEIGGDYDEELALLNHASQELHSIAAALEVC